MKTKVSKGSVVKNINKLYCGETYPISVYSQCPPVPVVAWVTVGLGLARSVFHPLCPAPRPDKHMKLPVNELLVSIVINTRPSAELSAMNERRGEAVSDAAANSESAEALPVLVPVTSTGRCGQWFNHGKKTCLITTDTLLCRITCDDQISK